MTPEDLKKYEQILLKREAELERELAATPLTTEMGNEPEGALYDTEADEAEEMTTNYALRQSLTEELNEVKTALKKIKDGTYGRCEKCGNDIGRDLLEVDPESSLCQNCKKSS